MELGEEERYSACALLTLALHLTQARHRPQTFSLHLSASSLHRWLRLLISSVLQADANAHLTTGAEEPALWG